MIHGQEFLNEWEKYNTGIFLRNNPHEILRLARMHLESHNKHYIDTKRRIHFNIMSARTDRDYWTGEMNFRGVTYGTMYPGYVWARSLAMQAEKRYEQCYKEAQDLDGCAGIYAHIINLAEQRIRAINARYVTAPLVIYQNWSEHFDYYEFVTKTKRIPIMFMEKNVVMAHMYEIFKQDGVCNLPSDIINVILEVMTITIKKHRRKMKAYKKEYYESGKPPGMLERMRRKFGPGWDYVVPSRAADRVVYDTAFTSNEIGNRTSSIDCD